MNEIATLMTDSEFKMFLRDFQYRIDLDGLRSYVSRRYQISEALCELDKRICFSVEQLRQIYDLAK